MAISRSDEIRKRRGTFDIENIGGSWEVCLVQQPNAAGTADLDAIVDQLVDRGVVGEHRRDVGRAIFDRSVPIPVGRWALLVTLPGQPWATVTAYDNDLVERSGLRTLSMGYEKVSSTTWFNLFEETELLVGFTSSASYDEEDEFAPPRFRGTWTPPDWIRALRSDRDVVDALARRFDAYAPYIGVTRTREAAIELYGFDREEFSPSDFARVDLIGFGGTQLDPTPADLALLAAIEGNHVAGIRAAVAAGANLRTLPGSKHSPLSLALCVSRASGPRLGRVATLLELGADVHNPGGESPLHLVIDGLETSAAEMIGVLQLLLDRGADINATGRRTRSRGSTPLHVAAQKYHLEICRFLMERGADVHVPNAAGLNPRQQLEASEKRLREAGAVPDRIPGPIADLLAFLGEAEAQNGDPA